MFRANKDHSQTDLFNQQNRLPEVIRKRLDNHWSTHFYNKVFRSIDESVFKELYSEDNGRPNFPTNILAGLEILKEMHALSDEQIYERYYFDLSYQRALGVEVIENYTFHLRTLYHFRAAVEAYEKRTGVNLHEKIFEHLRDDIIEDLSIQTGAQRTDSVMIRANIKRMSRLSLFHKVFSNVVKEVQKHGIPLSDRYLQYTKQDEDAFTYRMKSEDAKKALSDIGIRLRELLLDYKTTLANTKADKDGWRLLDEQCNTRSGRVSLKDSHGLSTGNMQNPVDPDATYRTKKEVSYQGYIAHAVETCDPDNPVQVITHADLVQNNVDDAKVLSSNLQKIKDTTAPEVIVADSGYVSDSVRETCSELGINFVATAIRGKASDKVQYTSVDFTTDAEGLIAKCPAGKLPISRRIEKDGSVSAVFDRKDCRACSFKHQCMAYHGDHRNGKIVADTNRLWLDERKKLLGTERYLSLCRMRPAVEGLMEKLKPKILNGRTLFRGSSRVKSRTMLRATALNFKRYLSVLLALLFSIFGRLKIRVVPQYGLAF